MAAAAQEWEAVLRDLPLRPPEIPVLSAATGALLASGDATSPRFWAQQLVQPVRFAAAAEELLDRGPAHVLEVGPGYGATTDVPRRKSNSLPCSIPSASPRTNPSANPAMEEASSRLFTIFSEVPMP